MKKSKKLISLLMVILTLFSIVSIIPASAATASNQYIVYIDKDAELSDIMYSTNGGLTYKKIPNTKLIFKAGQVVYFRTANKECFLTSFKNGGKVVTIDGTPMAYTEAGPITPVVLSKYDLKQTGTTITLDFDHTDVTWSKASYNAYNVLLVTSYPLLSSASAVANLLGL